MPSLFKKGKKYELEFCQIMNKRGYLTVHASASGGLYKSFIAPDCVVVKPAENGIEVWAVEIKFTSTNCIYFPMKEYYVLEKWSSLTKSYVAIRKKGIKKFYMVPIKEIICLNTCRACVPQAQFTIP